jgi:hypothetical protein
MRMLTVGNSTEPSEFPYPSYFIEALLWLFPHSLMQAHSALSSRSTWFPQPCVCCRRDFLNEEASFNNFRGKAEVQRRNISAGLLANCEIQVTATDTFRSDRIFCCWRVRGSSL